MSTKMEEGTRIDIVLANHTGAHATIAYNYKWDQRQGFDHVQIQVDINVHKLNDTYLAQVKPQHIKVPRAEDMPKMSIDQKDQENNDKIILFETIWEQHQTAYKSAVQKEDIDEAHHIWCQAAEQFLSTWFHEDPEHRWNPNTQLPKDKPCRGKPLPHIKKNIAGKYSNLTQADAIDHSAATANFIGKAKFLKPALERPTLRSLTITVG